MQNSRPTATLNAAMKPAARIIIADDHDIVREGLRRSLEPEAGLQIIADAATGDELLDLLRNNPCDLALVDLAMPGVSGLRLLQQILQEFPGVKVVVLSSYAEFKKMARRIGVHGFLLKSESSTRIVRALREILKGEAYFSNDLNRPGMSGAPGEISPEILSQREREILELVAAGLKNTEISEELDISLRTVEFHKSNIKTKLSLTTTAELIKYALRHDIVT